MRISCPTNKAFLESLKSDANERVTLAAGYGDPALQVADSGRDGGGRDVAYPVNRYVSIYQVPKHFALLFSLGAWCEMRSAKNERRNTKRAVLGVKCVVPAACPFLPAAWKRTAANDCVMRCQKAPA